MKKTLLGISAAAALAAPVATANAQSADSLIEKLVQKGVLSEKEGRELREESDKDFTRTFQAKTGMPDWVSSMRLGGDLRLRYDGIYIDDVKSAATTSDRNRLRYRLRFGPTFNLFDDYEIGIRLGSGEQKKGPTPLGDPISGNDTFTNNGGKKPLWIDLAYVKWTAINNASWSLALTGGKMENPFHLSDVLFDPDYTPEGFASQLSYRFSDAHSLKWNNGFFGLKESSSTSKDSYLMGTQLRWEGIWSPKLSTSLGASVLAISDRAQLNQPTATSGVPDVNSGNNRTGGLTGAPAAGFNPIVIDAAVSYTLESFPLYPGQFPIRLFGDYVDNPSAHSIRNHAYMAGVMFGKSGKKGTWDVSYRWKRLEGDYWYEELADSDHGAYYAAESSRGAAGYGPGVNIQGHYMRAAYSPKESLTLSVTYYLFKLIDTAPGAANPDTGRIQVDASWKF